MDFGQFNPVRTRQEQPEDFCAAHDRHMGCIGERQRLFDTVDNFSAVFLPIRGARQHDVAATGKQARQAFERLAPHDHRRTRGELLEAAKIGRQVPGERATFSDHAIIGARNDEDNFWSVHTATGAEIWAAA